MIHLTADVSDQSVARHRTTGWEAVDPRTGFEEGLRRAVDWFRRREQR